MNKLQKKFLFELLSLPSAPFREESVREFLIKKLQHRKVPHFVDPVGNLVLGVDSKADYLRLLKVKSAEPVRLFIAHMDHPGFHGHRWLSERRLEVKWHGGSPTRFLSGAPVWLADRDGYLEEGLLRKPVLSPGRRNLVSAEVQLESKALSESHGDAASLYGGLRFRKPVWQQGSKIYTRAADDLIGVYAIVETALSEFAGGKRPGPRPFLGLITRAEEVGFVGCVGHLQLDWLNSARRPVLAVSLEASRTLRGAEIGKGPVLRLGDWRTVFSSGGLRILSDLGARLLPGKHQRRIMDGGSCEATATTAWGLETIGMSVPLGNYHNQSLEGGPDSRGAHGPAPEFVHVDDIDGMVRMCRGLMARGLPWSDPWRETRHRLMKNKATYRRKL